MRTPWLLLPLAVACGPRPEAPPLHLEGALATEGGVDIWWTAPGTAPGEEEETELDDALVTLIDAATTSVDLALYEFDLELVQDAVLDAWDRGVDVRMVGDGDEAEDAGYEALQAAGIPIEMRPAGDRIMHNKFVVVDNQAVFTGSTNMSHNGIYRNNNHSIIVRSSAMAAAYTYELEEMFGGEFGRGKTALAGARSISLQDGSLEWHFSPTHDPIQNVVDAIDAANETVVFMVFSFTHGDVADALVRAQARGVAVVGIFDESQANGAWSVDETLAEMGVPVFIDGNENASGFSGGKLHHKVLVVDPGTEDAVVVSGSMNWSNAGTDDNDENLVVLRSPSVATPMMAAFCELLTIATPHPDSTVAAPDVCSDVDEEKVSLPGIVVNEVLGSGWDRRSRTHGFVELVSVDDTSVDLSGWQLQTGAGHVLHTFDGVLDAGEALVVSADSAACEGDGFVCADAVLLLADDPDLVLVDAEGTVVDNFPVGRPELVGSLARLFDGDASSPVVEHARLDASGSASSPGTRVDGRSWADGPTPDLLVLNELLADPDGDDLGQEYVELVNGGATPLRLEGYTLCDASGVCHTFAEQVMLPGQAVVLFDRGDHSDVPGALVSDSERLSLNNSGDTLTLTDPTGELHDSVTWTSSTAGVAWNREIDGDASADWARHDRVEGAMGTLSPGYRSSGLAWATGVSVE
jgi:phosphatidylserine/phosphatidylglycerophosphate/cardiolipin synthase-like enzyme